MVDLKEIVSYATENGFIYPSSEIYGGLQSVYDYAPNGTALKNNIKNIWWASMTQINNNILGIDSAIFMHPLTWKASGHIDSFNDLMIDNKDSKKRYRVDLLIEDHINNLTSKGQLDKSNKVSLALSNALKEQNIHSLYEIIKNEKIKCPVANTSNWSSIKQFNLMFSTQIGATVEDQTTIYLRPETAQGIFLNFLNVQKTNHVKIPFGIAQIGKAFRNEIIARQFTFRMREFEQMEMQFFVEPGQEQKWFEYWQEARLKWHTAIGINKDDITIYQHEQLAHYANNAIDIQYKFPFGNKEVEGVHSRTDFDLKQHQKYSNKKLEYFDYRSNKRYIPYVIETSIGCDRAVLMVLCNSLKTEKINDKERKYLKIHPYLAPNKIAILPLMKKPELVEVGMKIFSKLKLKMSAYYSESQSIGKRYAKQDIIGTPYCITVDNETLENETVTIRDRDTTEQERININQIKKYISKKISSKSILSQLPSLMC